MVHNKIVVVTDALPSNYLTAGSVLLQLHTELEKNFKVYYINLHNPELKYLVSGQLDPKSIFVFEKPKDYWHDTFRSKTLSGMSSYLGEFTSNLDCRIISKQIFDIVSMLKPISVLFVIESQTSVRIAYSLIHKLKIYSIGLFWDPIEWWLDARLLDKFSKNKILRKYYQILRKFDALLVPSSNMKDFFTKLGSKLTIELYPYYEN